MLSMLRKPYYFISYRLNGTGKFEVWLLAGKIRNSVWQRLRAKSVLIAKQIKNGGLTYKGFYGDSFNFYS